MIIKKVNVEIKEMPIPKAKIGSLGQIGKSKYPFDQLKVGQCFKINNSCVHTSAKRWAKNNNLDWKFTTRTIEENDKKVIYIWRIK